MGKYSGAILSALVVIVAAAAYATLFFLILDGIRSRTGGQDKHISRVTARSNRRNCSARFANQGTQRRTRA